MFREWYLIVNKHHQYCLLSQFSSSLLLYRSINFYHFVSILIIDGITCIVNKQRLEKGILKFTIKIQWNSILCICLCPRQSLGQKPQARVLTILTPTRPLTRTGETVLNFNASSPLVRSGNNLMDLKNFKSKFGSVKLRSTTLKYWVHASLFTCYRNLYYNYQSFNFITFTAPLASGKID